MPHNLTLEEFLALKRKTFERQYTLFQENWEHWSKADPEHYPEKLQEGDWEEQFIIFGDTIR